MPSQPQCTPVEEWRARAPLQPHTWFPSALLWPSRPDKLSWLGWGRAGARQPQLSLPSRPTPPCLAGYEPCSCPWTEPGLSPRLSSVTTKAAASCHVPQRRPEGPWGSHPRHPVPCRTLLGHSWRARLWAAEAHVGTSVTEEGGVPVILRLVTQMSLGPARVRPTGQNTAHPLSG